MLSQIRCCRGCGPEHLSPWPKAGSSSLCRAHLASFGHGVSSFLNCDEPYPEELESPARAQRGLLSPDFPPHSHPSGQ